MTQQVYNNRAIWTPDRLVETGIEGRIAYLTQLGVLYKGDLLKVLPHICAESVDTIFVDPF